MKPRFVRVCLIVLIFSMPWLVNQSDTLWGISKSDVIKHAGKEAKCLMLLCAIGAAAVLCARIVAPKRKPPSEPNEPLQPGRMPPTVPHVQQRLPPQQNNRGYYQQ